VITYFGKQELFSIDIEDAKRCVDLAKRIEDGELNLENANELTNYVEDFLRHVKYFTEVTEQTRLETDEEAREYFGEKFINEYEDILKYCRENKHLLYIHGTSTGCLNEICKEGLKYKNNTINSTACGTNTEKADYVKLLNWPHYDCKGLALIVIPKDSLGKIWKKNDNMQDNYFYSDRYYIAPEFIIATANIDDKKIMINQNYKHEHDYTNFEGDFNISRWMKIMNNKGKIKTVEFPEEHTQPVKLQAAESERDYIVELQDIVYNFQCNINGLRCFENKISKDEHQDQLDSIQNNLNHLKEIKDQVPTKFEYIRMSKNSDNSITW